MKRLLALTVVMFLGAAPLAGAQSVTYQISAVIPAIVGVNVPDPDATQAGIDAQLEKFVERVMRDEQPVILETIVAR